MNDNRIYIYGKRTVEVLFEIISRLNSYPDNTLILEAYSSCASQALRIVNILNRFIGIEVQKGGIGVKEVSGVKSSSISIPIKLSIDHKLKYSLKDKEEWLEEDDNNNFINFSTYHLLIDWFLHNNSQISLLVRHFDQPLELLQLSTLDNGKEIEFLFESSDSNKWIEDKINKAFLRCGIHFSDKWEQIALKLSEKDDIILGLDTNVVYDCLISEQILPTVSVLNTREYVNTPNWILIVIPSTLLYELESASNLRDEQGHLTFSGRQAYRGLQEIMELSHNTDIPGVSLIITGETNPNLDIVNALKKINASLHSASKDSNFEIPKRFLFKSSSEDMLIRSQFNNFLNSINFHKNSFFLTSDKSAAALGTAEGIDTIYVSQNGSRANQFFDFGDSHSDDESLVMHSPIGSLVYELAVNFESIYLKFGDHIVGFSCDSKGDLLGRWMRKQLRIDNTYLKDLVKDYNGEFDLQKCYEIFNLISTNYEDSHSFSSMENVFQ